jgi:hypothetical protein
VKFCSHCGNELPNELFRKHSTICKTCQYLKSVGSKAIHRTKRLKAINERIDAILLTTPCINCGEADIRVLDFHHVDDTSKLYSISDLRRIAVSEDTLNTEIDKCSVLCANCHILNKFNNSNKSWRKYVKKGRDYVDNYLVENGPCKDCGESNIKVLVFHHRDPSTKVANVSYMVGANRSTSVIQEEMDKCDILCHNCHRKIHSKEYS